MDFNVGAVSIANAVATQAKAAELVSTAKILTTLFDNDGYDECDTCDTFQDYADIYAEGEDEIDRLYALKCATASIWERPSKKEVRDEYTATHPEYALARVFCEGIEKKGDKYIERKMRLYDLTHPTSSFFSKDRQEYLALIEAEYRLLHPEYDMIKTAKEEVKKPIINIIF